MIARNRRTLLGVWCTIANAPHADELAVGTIMFVTSLVVGRVGIRFDTHASSLRPR